MEVAEIATGKQFEGFPWFVVKYSVVSLVAGVLSKQAGQNY